MDKLPKRRLFAAIALPEEAQKTLADMQQKISGAKWVAPSHQLHITLAFIGGVPDKELNDICMGLSRVIDLPAEIKLQGVGFWGSRVLWTGVEATPSLVTLKEAVEAALDSVKCSYEKRDFKPHITLARMEPKFDVGALNSFLTTHKDFRMEPFTATEFSLYESLPGPEKSIYLPLIHFLQVNPFPDMQM